MPVDTEHLHKVIERAFWRLTGVVGSLCTAGVTAVVGILWSMNGSIATLNERVGSVVERLVLQEERSKVIDEQLHDHSSTLSSFADRLRLIESHQEKSRH